MRGPLAHTGRVGLLVLAVLGALSMPGHRSVPLARAAESWVVEARAFDPDELLGVTAFVPNPLTIHVGDSVHWTIEGAHTVTFLGAQGDAAALPAFVPGGPFAGGRVAGPGFFPIGPEGPYDGTDVRSSGRPAARDTDAPYVLTFTTPGVFAYLCLTHPGMNGTVTVVPAGTELPETPAEAAARGQAQRAGLLNDLRAGLQAVRTAAVAAPSGTRAHAVAAGLSDGAGASALQFVPAALTVQRGDLVLWMVTDPLEIHTVTFTSGAPPPDVAEVVPQPHGTVLFVQRPEAYRPVGGTTYTGAGYLSSGFLPGGARGTIAFVLAMDAPPGSYEYLCLVHGGMKATITVAE